MSEQLKNQHEQIRHAFTADGNGMSKHSCTDAEWLAVLEANNIAMEERLAELEDLESTSQSIIKGLLSIRDGLEAELAAAKAENALLRQTIQRMREEFHYCMKHAGGLDECLDGFCAGYREALEETK